MSLNKEIDSDCSNLQFNTTLCISSPLSPDCSPLYTVQPNDTCTSIANALNISYSILYLNNPQTENQCTDINVGEVRIIFFRLSRPVLNQSFSFLDTYYTGPLCKRLGAMVPRVWCNRSSHEKRLLFRSRPHLDCSLSHSIKSPRLVLRSSKTLPSCSDLSSSWPFLQNAPS